MEERLSWATERHGKMGGPHLWEAKLPPSQESNETSLNFENDGMAHQLQSTLSSVIDSFLYMFPLR